MAINEIFSKLLGNSPLQPLQQPMRVVRECVRLVPMLFNASIANDQGQIEAIKGSIDELEGEADFIKNEIRAHLPKSLMLPVNRMDVLQVLQMQDAIADTAQDLASVLVVCRKAAVRS